MLAARALSKATPARAAVSRAAGSAAPKRGMAAGGPPPKYTGIEAQVRARLPKDEQLVVAIIGFYASLYVVGKGVSSIFSSPKSKAPPVSPPVPGPVAPPLPGSGGGSSIPTGDDFWQWLDGSGNMEKFLDSIEK